MRAGLVRDLAVALAGLGLLIALPMLFPQPALRDFPRLDDENEGHEGEHQPVDEEREADRPEGAGEADATSPSPSRASACSSPCRCCFPSRPCATS
jgi:hypothetical protein